MELVSGLVGLETSGETSNVTTIGLIIIGGGLLITGSLINSQIIQIVGAMIFIPAIGSYSTEVGKDVLDFLKNLESLAPVLLTVAVVGGIGTIIAVRSNFVANTVLLVGVTIVIYGITYKKNKQQTRIEYRFVPRTFKEEQENPVKPSEIFEDIFAKPTPWPAGSFESNQTNFIGRRKQISGFSGTLRNARF